MNIILTVSFCADTFVGFVQPAYTFREADGIGFIEIEKIGIVQEDFSVAVQGGTYTY